MRFIALTLFVALVLGACSDVDRQQDGAAFETVTLSFAGPLVDEQSTPNPFSDYRLSVTFRHDESGVEIVVPGYFAADGSAANTSGTAGDVWRVHFVPQHPGEWQYVVSFRTGADIAITLDPSAGDPVQPDGERGRLQIAEADPMAPGFLSRGMARYVGERYMRFDDGSYLLKGGSDSPENLLGYADFDGTYTIAEPGSEREGEAPTARQHRYQPHVADWRPGDATWKNGLGKGLIGGLNYLASSGLNAFSFLTMNVEGDGKDVWPWTAPDARDRFDVSKLAQWQIVFTYADTLGLFLHFKTQETENDLLLDGGELGRERRLYYRELVARFAHHRHAIRRYTLWGNLMAGGAGVEYYFGYINPDNDLNLENWRSRDTVWKDVDHALRFFNAHVPFAKMLPVDGAASNPDARVFAAEDCRPCLVQLPAGGTTALDLPAGAFEVRWFNPRLGGDLQIGSVASVIGPGRIDLGAPPAEPMEDWVVLVR